LISMFLLTKLEASSFSIHDPRIYITITGLCS
jgi:hypothetical protein